MDIGFVWDESKYQAVRKQHDVKFYEVVSAFEDPVGYEAVDPTEQEDRWLWIGQTHEKLINQALREWLSAKDLKALVRTELREMVEQVLSSNQVGIDGLMRK